MKRLSQMKIFKKKNKRSVLVFLCFVALQIPFAVVAQENRIQWLGFEQLEDSLALKPKKILINFYADWCVYCKKMEKAAYKDAKIISELNSRYYAVKMNAESSDTIHFGGDTFYNKELGHKRNPTHEIALLLASRKDRPFTLPAVVILNEKFEVTDRYFEYLSPKRLYWILKD